MSRRFDFVTVSASRQCEPAGSAPHLDLRPATDEEWEAVVPLGRPFGSRQDIEERALALAEELAARRTRRLAQLDAEPRLSSQAPVLAGIALIAPAGLIARRAGAPPPATRDPAAIDRIQHRSEQAALAAERALGNRPELLAHNNPGYDIRSITPDGGPRLIEVPLPVEAISIASQRDRDRSVGTVQNVHKWFTSMPTPAWRALMFASLVDDPGNDVARRELLALVERLVPRDGGPPRPDEFAEAGRLIAEAVEGELPLVLDPFCGSLRSP